ncbi:MAG: type II secretion system protein [Cyanobacteria bacterium P01_A01_bin.17]
MGLFRFLQYFRGRWSTQHSGFTLIEKMIIVAVVGILGAVTAPSLSKMLDRVKLDQATKEVRSALDETQREAIRGNKSCIVTLNLVESEVTGNCLQAGNRNLPERISLATNMVSNLDVGLPSGTAETFPPAADVASTITDVDTGLGLSRDRPTKVAVATKPVAPKASMTIQIISQAPACSQTAGQQSSNNCGNKKSNQAQQGQSSPSPSPSPSSPPPGVSVTPIPIQYGALGTPNFAVVSELSRPADPTGKIVFSLANNESVERKCIAISNTLGLTRIGSYRGDLEPSKITDEGACTATSWTTQ